MSITKLILLTLVSFLITFSNALSDLPVFLETEKNRSRFYAGINGNINQATNSINCDYEHNADCSQYWIGDKTSLQSGWSVKSTSGGAGLFTGWNYAMKNLFIGHEEFAEYLGNNINLYYRDRSQNPSQDNQYKDAELNLRYRYGIRAKLGYQMGNLGLFISYGLANTEYRYKTFKNSMSYDTRNDSTWAPIYGFGMRYFLNKAWAITASYDQSEFSTYYNSQNTGERFQNEVKIDTARIGLMFVFL